jgi:hypothetical protein
MNTPADQSRELTEETLGDVVRAWVREDLDTGAKMTIGFYGPKLITRLEAWNRRADRSRDAGSEGSGPEGTK